MQSNDDESHEEPEGAVDAERVDGVGAPASENGDAPASESERGKSRRDRKGSTQLEVAKSISRRLKKSTTFASGLANARNRFLQLQLYS